MNTTNLRNRIEERKSINVPVPVQSNNTFNFEQIENELEQELNKTRKTQSYGGGFQSNRNPTSQLPRKNDNNNRNETYYSTKTSSPSLNSTRTGMSAIAWHWVFNATEVVLDVIKGIMIVGGIIASNLADFIMGSIGISLIVNTKISSLTFVNGFGFGSVLSMGSSAIQIYMWSLIQKRGITAKMLLNPKMWKNIPQDVRGFLWSALFLWIIDTILDVSPTFVLFTPENFTNMMWLYYLLVTSVIIIVTILCGFAEILTSNMRAMLAGSK